MRVGFIGDVVGRPGRRLIKNNLKALREEYALDLVVANTENATHGFGINIKNANELFATGIDMMTGGNHTWDKREIIGVLDTLPILRPLNYPKGVPGKGVGYLECKDYRLAVINAMGHFAMPQTQNAFLAIEEALENLEPSDGILIDFHAEATSEKRTLLSLLKGKVSAIIGTHTHIGTDDLTIVEETGYLTDIGLTGCRDNVIGMDPKGPITRALTGIPAPMEVPNQCKGILQMVVFELNGLCCKEAFKIKIYEGYENSPIIIKAWHEQ
ncbi:MAG: YmdB family metallophosphoesterase [Campylobacteraceae bacterium]|nr:YmdB family metallophosphoesterase [Campylobacteraceae bacterium]